MAAPPCTDRHTPSPVTATARGLVELTIPVSRTVRVSGLLQRPGTAQVCLVLAPGAGAGMRHPFMSALSDELASREIATLRFEFPYMERRSRRPDPPTICHATVRAAVAAACQRLPQMPLLAGGKSFGGRMTSQAQAQQPLSEVRGLVFFGFPLHPAGRPSEERASHLADVKLPMLFLQGTRDALAQPTLLRSMLERLGERASVVWFEDADHSFHAPASSGITDRDIRLRMGEAIAVWARAVIERG